MERKEVMEVNVFWDVVKIIISGIFGIGLASIFPIIIQLRREREEKDKIRAEATDISAEAVKKIITAAGDLQEGYQEFIDEMKSKASEYRQEILDLSLRVKELEKSNIELRHLVEESTLVIIELREGIRLLSKQIESLDHKPIWTDTREGEK